MAWTTPQTWAAGQLVREEDSRQIVENQEVLKTSRDDSGKLKALDATTLADLDGTNLTDVAKTAGGNTYTAGTQNFNGGATTRFVIPTGANKWAT